MRTLIDTNILLRSSQPNSPHHAISLAAVAALFTAGRSVCIASQAIYEFLAVATRPTSENGLGMAHRDADAQLSKLLTGFDVLYDSESVATELRRLVVTHQVTGKRVHDAKLAAIMAVFGIRELLTFNGDDFKRFPHVTVLLPGDAARGVVPDS